MTRPNDSNERSYWLDQPKNVTRLFRGLVVVCALLALTDLFRHKHGHFTFEDWFTFNGWFGFVSCVLLVLAATQLRKLVMRNEDYYDDRKERSE